MMLRKPLAVTAIAALTGLALSACTPPNQKDSDIKVDTATSVQAPTPAATTTAVEGEVVESTAVETEVVVSEVAPMEATETVVVEEAPAEAPAN